MSDAWLLELKRMLLRRICKRRESDTGDANKQSSLVLGNPIIKDTTGGQTLLTEDIMEADMEIICYCQQ